MILIGDEGNVGYILFYVVFVLFVMLYAMGTDLSVIEGIDESYFTSSTEAPGLLTWLGNIGKIGILFSVSSTFQFLALIIGILTIGLFMVIIRLVRG